MQNELNAEAGESRKYSVAKSGLIFFTIFFSGFLLFNCSAGSDKQRKDSSSKFTQYYNQGQKLYEKHCSNCHQKNGTGLGRVYPPLNVSDFMDTNFNDVLCLMRHGKKGELIVNGVRFNQPMPGIPLLTDLEIAEIATYIYNTWNHNRGLIDVKEVSPILLNCEPSE